MKQLVSPQYCPVILQFRLKTNGCCFGSAQAVAASQSSTAKAPLEERGTVVLPVLSEQITEPPVIEDPLGSRWSPQTKMWDRLRAPGTLVRRHDGFQFVPCPRGEVTSFLLDVTWHLRNTRLVTTYTHASEAKKRSQCVQSPPSSFHNFHLVKLWAHHL